MHKKCLIIGASGGIGQAVARYLAQTGYKVGLQYNSNSRTIADLKKEISKEQWIGAYQADLSSTEGIYTLLEAMDEQWDAIVFAGGHMWSGLFQDMSPRDMDALYHVHIKAVWMISRQILPSMITKKYGRIVVVSSIFGVEGASLEAAYSSVKGAQNSFVKGLAKEVAPSGIRVNAVAPGLIQTKMNAHLSDEELFSLEEDIPMGRAGSAEEVAETIEFLLGDQSSYITGQIIQVNGGWA
ncbi:elongation factor P 5-aminopentanone reductase [Halobacillus litoralis]|uniref:elongation factor P 5-aminopentanone reductase n=1 Tax=Halobacillus litoralis TaxID=45668 RepID=UPI001CFD82DC|nr:SDR family oxidoreductase [Halobacillus litoralis]